MSKVVRVDSVFAFPLCSLFMYFGKIFLNTVSLGLFTFFYRNIYDVQSIAANLFHSISLLFFQQPLLDDYQPGLDDPAWLPRFVKACSDT